MATSKTLRRMVRDRMARTNESYTVALAALKAALPTRMITRGDGTAETQLARALRPDDVAPEDSDECDT